LKNRQQGRQLKETDNKRNQGSISPTFNEQLLHAQFPKVHKDTADLTAFFALLGYGSERQTTRQTKIRRKKGTNDKRLTSI